MCDEEGVGIPSYAGISLGYPLLDHHRVLLDRVLAGDKRDSEVHRIRCDGARAGRQEPPQLCPVRNAQH